MQMPCKNKQMPESPAHVIVGKRTALKALSKERIRDSNLLPSKASV